MIVDVIMLSLTSNSEQHQMTLNAIKTLKESDPSFKFNIILVESNKNIELSVYSGVVDNFIIPEEEFNYNKFCNIGLTVSNNEWVCLCNNDLIFHENWFSEILKTKKENPKLKSFSPWNSFDQWHETRMKDEKDYYQGYGIGHELCGWCLVFERNILNKIILDERVSFWFSDNIYGDELRKNYIKHALVRNSKVDHLVSKTLLTQSPSKIEELTVGQQRKYNNV